MARSLTTHHPARESRGSRLLLQYGPWAGVAARLVLGGVWLAAGLLKIGDPTENVRAVRAYDLLPEAVVPAVGHALPVLEIALGIMLLVGLATRLSAAVSVGLLVAFVVGIASAWARGLSIECGCFGGGGGPAENADAAYPWELARDAGLLLLAGFLVWRPRTPFALDNRLFSQKRVPSWKADTVRRRDRGVVAMTALALVLVVGLGAVVQSTRDVTGEVTATPDGTVDSYALGVGSDDAPVVVDVYEDFLCPYCGQLEQLTEETVDQFAGEDVQFRYHVLSFLDRASTDRYSTRAANALGAVLDASGPEVAKRFHDLLYADQPAEGGAGLSDEQLVELAVQAGADEAAVQEPIEDLRFRTWVANGTDAASRSGVTGTPTVLVDGERLGGATIPDMATQLHQTLEDTTG